MKIRRFQLALLFSSSLIFAAPSIKLVYSTVVNDTIPDAHGCAGLAIAPNGDYLAAFNDRCDAGPGSSLYLVRSADQGRTWGTPEICIKPDSKTEGVAGGVFNYPDGTLGMAKTRIFYDCEDQNKAIYHGNRDSAVELYVSHDNGKTFQFLDALKKPSGALLATMGGVTTALANGDWVINAFIYPYANREPDYPYGSGLYRSTDKGKTWGSFERIFREPDPKKPFNFNESACAVGNDGTIVVFARIDSRPMKECSHFRVISRDHGKTWTMPEDTGRICGDYPRIIKLDDNQGFLMVCGYRAALPVLGTVTFFHSPDGMEFTEIGRAFYQPDNRHVPANSATGGVQSIMHGPEKNQFYVIFYAHDPKLPGKHRLRIEGNMIEFIP
ncbi:MAG: exo-alpha-sialidase [Oligosphaeraceae bacterium]|nr:exo-alpha-sialidase [Oligosphaeraceae bacterium]